jgi:hypothetical protein
MSDIVSWSEIRPTIIKEYPHAVIIDNAFDFGNPGRLEEMAKWCQHHFGEEALIELDAEQPIYRYINSNVWTYGTTGVPESAGFFFKNHQDAVLFRISCT